MIIYFILITKQLFVDVLKGNLHADKLGGAERIKDFCVAHSDYNCYSFQPSSLMSAVNGLNPPPPRKHQSDVKCDQIDFTLAALEKGPLYPF